VVFYSSIGWKLEVSSFIHLMSSIHLFLFLSLILLQEISTYSMRIVVQRVKSASVTVDSNVVSQIGPGVLALVGLHENDTVENLQDCCRKLLACKLWENENGGQWRHGVKQKNYEVLCVSQFTLYGKLSKKNQPDYKYAMKSLPASEMYSKFLEMLRENYQDDKIRDGRFGAMMDVELINDGPVTLVIESEPCGSENPSLNSIEDDP
jgi:D-aminoacyl-tRNA deacylase